jgi:carboxymethylenebutenolidase
MINPELQRYVRRLNPAQHYLVTEFVENYEDGVLRRRDLLERVLRITGSAAAAAGTLLALGVPPAFADPRAAADFAPPAQTGPTSPLSVPADDPAVRGGSLSVRAFDGATLLAYLARPAAAGRYPAVLIAHENQGLVEHFEDVARRYAKAGYVAMVLDLLSRRGGTAAVPENERGAGLTGPDVAPQIVADFQALMAYLRQQPYVLPDRIGITGFCLGGSIAFDVVTKEPSLRAAAPYYGVPDFPDELRNVRAAVFAAYGELDTRVDASIPSTAQGLTAAGVPFRQVVYPGAAHAFFNDTRPFTGTLGYVESAALAAWQDTLAWFDTYLRGGAGRLPATGDGSQAPDATEGDAAAPA